MPHNTVANFGERGEVAFRYAANCKYESLQALIQVLSGALKPDIRSTTPGVYRVWINAP